MGSCCRVETVASRSLLYNQLHRLSHIEMGERAGVVLSEVQDLLVHLGAKLRELLIAKCKKLEPLVMAPSNRSGGKRRSHRPSRSGSALGQLLGRALRRCARRC